MDGVDQFCRKHLWLVLKEFFRIDGFVRDVRIFLFELFVSVVATAVVIVVSYFIGVILLGLLEYTPFGVMSHFPVKAENLWAFPLIFGLCAILVPGISILLLYTLWGKLQECWIDAKYAVYYTNKPTDKESTPQ